MKNDRSGECEKNLNANVKSGRSGKCENKSTLNVKSGRSGKCEKIYVECEKGLVTCMTSQMVSLDNLVGLVSFVGILGFGVSTFKS